MLSETYYFFHFYDFNVGHVCLTDNDKDNARNNKGSLLYGELLPRGANKVFQSFASIPSLFTCSNSFLISLLRKNL